MKIKPFMVFSETFWMHTYREGEVSRSRSDWETV